MSGFLILKLSLQSHHRVAPSKSTTHFYLEPPKRWLSGRDLSLFQTSSNPPTWAQSPQDDPGLPRRRVVKKEGAERPVTFLRADRGGLRGLGKAALSFSKGGEAAATHPP